MADNNGNNKTNEYGDVRTDISTTDEIPVPQLGGIPEPSLSLERYLAELDSFQELTDEHTGQTILVGHLPNYCKRRFYGLNGKHVINSFFTEKDLRVRKLKNFRSRIKEEMFTPVSKLNANFGRTILDLDQAWIMNDDLATQARGGAHSKQRTTVTSISMAGRLDNTPQQQHQPVKQSPPGGFY